MVGRFACLHRTFEEGLQDAQIASTRSAGAADPFSRNAVGWPLYQSIAPIGKRDHEREEEEADRVRHQAGCGEAAMSIRRLHDLPA